MRRSTIFRLLLPVSQFVARQLSHPSGWFGGKVMVHVLNRGNRQLISEAVRRLEPTTQTRLLDVGFGGGLSLQLARQAGVSQLVGVDPSHAAVDTIKKTSPQWLKGAELEALHGSVESLPLANESVDAVISTNTIYFWPDLSRAFRELWRVLRPGGRVVIGFSSNEKLRSFSTVTRHGFLFHEEPVVVSHAKNAGFADVQLVELHHEDTAGDRLLMATKRASSRERDTHDEE